jgi:pilus assembly protein Flp/PilA
MHLQVEAGKAAMTLDLRSLRRRAGWLRDETGAVAIEYALIASLVSVAIVAALISIGGDLGNVFHVVGNGFNTVP